ncbi:SLC13 family permease [Portibacter marinus]|uniref:SLC13 family permease n=1 Tax=Portibacter marinus TaxID=2898660 RepID=UPI001F1FDA88|nr:SLC13 family permease [Portibacter marinus]
MNADIIILLSILAVSIVIFALELLPVDKTAFGIMVLLTAFGLVTPEEAISGFSNPAVITILNLMIIAWALERNGVIKLLSNALSPVVKWPFIFAIPVLMVAVGTISAFISTTAVVIVFIKMISELHAQGKLDNAMYLLPISFAGIVGGSATLMGTSTNLIVNEIAERRGVTKLGFFEFTGFGLVFMAIAIVVVAILVPFVIRKRKRGPLIDAYQIDDYITNIQLSSTSAYAGQTIKEIPSLNEDDINILSVERRNTGVFSPSKFYRIDQNDKILIRATVEKLAELKDNDEYVILNAKDNIATDEHDRDDFEIGEVIVMPGSNVIGSSLKQLTNMFGNSAIPLAIKKHKTILNQKSRIVKDLDSTITIEAGDRILLSTNKDFLSELERERNFLLFEEYEDVTAVRPWRRNFAILTLLIVVGLAASGTTNILLATLIGSFLLIFTGATSLSNAYKAINWPVIFLLAGMIPIGIAMQNTGADDFLINQLTILFSSLAPTIVMALLFLFTMVMSGVISNNATAIIMTPIAIALALKLDIDPKAFILAVMFSANFSFFTPIGYQTNTIIYGMGIYRFKHFLVIGGILSFLLWIAAIYLLQMRYL